MRSKLYFNYWNW